MKTATNEFNELLQSSINAGNFIKLTLSKPAKADAAQNVYGRLVQLKKGTALCCTLRYASKDITQNYLLGVELETQLKDWIGKDYKIATLITTEEEVALQFNKKGVAQMRRKGQERKAVEPKAHNKEKQYTITEESRFLQLLGISSTEGRVFGEQQEKFRQINKYAELMRSLLEQSGLANPTAADKPLRIVDMGSGKGYLTFALYSLLQQHLSQKVAILGVELRSELCDFCNEQARSLGWQEGLRFEAMDILNYNEGDIDVLIALHACDIATDIAIVQGIRNGANLIVVAPCCHKQIRQAMKPKGPWAEILKQGIMLERQAELLTDALRALLLQREGYKTKVFEFISAADTPKNIMIAGIKNKQTLSEAELATLNRDIATLKADFGITEHYLEKLLQG